MKRTNALLLVLALFILSSEFLSAQRVVGDGPIVSETVNMKDITGVGLGISGDVYLTQGSKQSITIKGQQNIIDLLVKDVKNDTWDIRFPKKTNVRMNEKLEIHITMKTLESLNIGGSGSIHGKSKFSNLKDVSMNIGGSGSIDLELDGEEVSCNIGGSGGMNLEGSADHLDANIGGSGSIKAIDLKVNTAKVNTAGSGSVRIHVEDELTATIVGSGGVKYKGDPKVNKTVMGSGRIKAY